MKVLVTGGTGEVGRSAVARLVRNGHEVKVIGRREGLTIEGGEYQVCDTTDYASLREQIRGTEGVVHLAAIPYPAGGPGEEIFRINCAGSFNVYQAAAEEGIRRVVSASSINALGFNFGVKPFELSYFPIDEEHPCFTTDAYSFSKQVLEETAAYFWRREGISGACLRLPAVYEVGKGRRRRAGEFRARARETYGEFLALPEEEQKERVRGALAMIDRMRGERGFEIPGFWRKMDRSESLLIFGINNFWTSINAEDSAQAIEKGLLAEYEGSHPLFVNDSHNTVGFESESLARVFFPQVGERKRALKGTESLVSIERARALLGFEPEHSVSQWFPSADSPGRSEQAEQNQPL